MSTKRRQSTAAVIERSDVEYDAFLRKIQSRFVAHLALGPLCTTNVEGLFDTYLSSFPRRDRQYHTCSACRNFFKRFGGLVVIDERGRTIPALWNEEDAPEYLKVPVASIQRLVEKAKVTGAFLSKLPVWGQPVTGEWRHLAVAPPLSHVYQGLGYTAGQAMAEKHEDFLTVMRALEQYTLPMLETAITILKSESLYRSEKVVGPATWLYELQSSRNGSRGVWSNRVWRAVASAPAGFCHPQNSMIGTLLADIAAGMEFSQIASRFKSKMHPLLYQRPQTPPSEGNIEQAEKLVEKLGIAESLKRRFARLEEIEAIWSPAVEKDAPGSGGVFSHLKAKGESNRIIIPPTPPMTWVKFAKTVLPTAERIECYVEHGNQNFCAITTAVKMEAPPILQWDRPDKRNQCAWYVWNGGSRPEQWKLAGGTLVPVSSIAYKPSMWGDPEAFSHQGASVVLILQGAQETRLNGGLALFPECLKAELREVRSTIEAFSRNGKLEGSEAASACGLVLSKGGSWNVRLRVTAGKSIMDYTLDRWE